MPRSIPNPLEPPLPLPLHVLPFFLFLDPPLERGAVRRRYAVERRRSDVKYLLQLLSQGRRQAGCKYSSCEGLLKGGARFPRTFLSDETDCSKIEEVARRVEEGEDGPVACLFCERADQLRIGRLLEELVAVNDERFPAICCTYGQYMRINPGKCVRMYTYR